MLKAKHQFSDLTFVYGYTAAVSHVFITDGRRQNIHTISEAHWGQFKRDPEFLFECGKL